MADGDGLENRCSRKGTVGSNPTPSASLLLYPHLVQLCQAHGVKLIAFHVRLH